MRRGGESKEGTHTAASVRTGQGLVEALGLVGVAWGQEVWGGPFRAMSLYLASERLCSLSGNSVICHMGGAPCLLSTVPSPYHPILIPSPLSGSPASPQETLRRSDPFPSFIPSLVSVNFFCSSLNFARPRSVICRSSSHHVQPHHGPAPAASYLGNLCPVQLLLLGLLSCSCLVAALLSTWPPCSSSRGLRLKATF